MIKLKIESNINNLVGKVTVFLEDFIIHEDEKYTSTVDSYLRTVLGAYLQETFHKARNSSPLSAWWHDNKIQAAREGGKPDWIVETMKARHWSGVRLQGGAWLPIKHVGPWQQTGFTEALFQKDVIGRKPRKQFLQGRDIEAGWVGYNVFSSMGDRDNLRKEGGRTYLEIYQDKIAKFNNGDTIMELSDSHKDKIAKELEWRIGEYLESKLPKDE